MKPLLLHIGSTKTGTSSLQRFLSGSAKDLRRNGVVYPRAGLVGSPRIAHHNLCYQFQAGRVKTGVFKPSAGTWDDALEEIDESATVTGVVSSEAFMNCWPQQVPSFAGVLEDRSASVVAYVRRQDRWLESAWNQQARFGRAGLNFWGFVERVRERGRGDYHGMLEPWAQAFGVGSVFVRNFDALPAGGIIPDFVHTFLAGLSLPSLRDDGTPDSSQPRHNTKAGIKQLLAVSLVSEICRERISPEFRLPTSSAIKIADFFRHRPGETTRFSALSYDEARRIHEIYGDSNRALSSTYASFAASGGFSPPRPEDYSDHVRIEELDETSLDREERAFVTRMAREVTRASAKSLSARTRKQKA